MEYSRVYNGTRKPGALAASPAALSVEVRPSVPQFANAMQGAKLAYQAAVSSKFRRTREDLGGTADAHYRNGLSYWQLREYARDMDRNDAILGQLVDRALDNILGAGLQPDPQTTDEGLNQELIDSWEEWSTDELQCDYAQRRDFAAIERLALRHRFVDGDCCILPIVDPDRNTLQLQLLEGDRLPETVNVFEDIVHGIEIDYKTDRVIAYSFTQPRKGERQLGGRRTPFTVLSSQVTRIPARDDQGRLQVYHLYDPQRVTQSRGVTAFRAVFDILGQFEDLNFAKLVQQQVVSMIAVFIQRERDFTFGNRATESRTDGASNTFEEMTPGMTVRLKPGETIAGFTPNVPNPEFFHHVRLILRLIGCAVGMPLELVLLDTSDTTFHGYRGALQQAQKSFSRQQKLLPRQFHRHVWKRHVDRVLKGQRGARRWKYRCIWRGEGWPYVDPRLDAQADHTRLSSGLASPRRIQAERGFDWKDVAVEIVEDWGTAIELAAERAHKINAQFPDAFITWKDVLNLKLDTVKGGVGEIAAQAKYSGLGGAGTDKAIHGPGGHLIGSVAQTPDKSGPKDAK